MKKNKTRKRNSTSADYFIPGSQYARGSNLKTCHAQGFLSNSFEPSDLLKIIKPQF